jgi:hypothetical protein
VTKFTTLCTTCLSARNSIIWAAINTCIRLVEDYRPGYPRYTTLLAAYDPYFICRRFSKLRARMLLLKQDQLSMLEEKLEELDREERCALFLGKSRCDGNQKRISLLSEIDSRMLDYGKYRPKTWMLAANKRNKPIRRQDA